MTVVTWQILKVLQTVRQGGGRLTLGGLAALVRGGRKGNFDVAVKRRGRKAGPGGDEAGKGNVDVDDLVGGPVEMKKLVGCSYSGIFWEVVRALQLIFKGLAFFFCLQSSLITSPFLFRLLIHLSFYRTSNIYWSNF